jgi:hypothetical protein
MTGSIPSEIGVLSSLGTWTTLFWCNVQHACAAIISSFFSPEYLKTGPSSIVGSIPTSIGQLSNLGEH